MGLAKPLHTALFDPRKELRAQPRTRLDVQGTLFMPDNGYELKCAVLDLSPDGAGVKSTCSAAVGTPVVLHVQGLGRYEGTIIRRDRVNVGVRFRYSEAKRARVAEVIAAYVAGVSSSSTPTRNTARVGGFTLPYKFSLESGESGDCEIVDIALTGVAFKATARPAIGERLFFGKSAAVVARHTKDGFAVAFIQANDAFPTDP
jgi:hypothetical protein